MSRKNKQHKQILERLRNLSEQRKQILALTPDKALDRILDAPQPAALVHSFQEDDFYYLIQDIGPEDSLPLLALASDRQWEYLMDREIWERDKIELSSVTRWLNLMLQANSARTIKWFIEQKIDYAEYYLFKNIEVVVRETDQDPSEIGTDFFTFDDALYIRILDIPTGDEADEEADEEAEKDRKETIKRFLDLLAVYDYKKYQSLLLESKDIIPAETEEETYRLRNVRLAEKGFLPFEEAVGIYQPIQPEDLSKQTSKYMTHTVDTDYLLPIPFYSVNMLEGADLFTNALHHIASGTVIEQLQSEFAALCNQIIVADQKQIKAKKELHPVVEKASGYLNIGLQELTKKAPGHKIQQASEYIETYPLHQIFRTGFGAALSIKWQTERWRKNAWFEKQGLPLSFWGEEWLGVLGGLLIKKPLFFDNHKTGELYREFHSLDDITHTEAILNTVIGFDDLLSQMNIQFTETPRRFMTYKSMLLTLWARHYLGLSDALMPLTLDELKTFFDQLFEKSQKNVLKKPRKTQSRLKSSLLNWISGKSGIDPYGISQKIGQPLETLFVEVESEYGSVEKKDLDPRFIYLFLVER